ncbi:hypothetical protein [Polynucleobacter sp. Adler-ghost]|uniref:hypothetical protein n=1 Tax=Polynucleobacter sp. Adler-ghost TaxID=2770234 RepID=UPI001BFD7558|nr:hypothetical protein [Polynucleobacter sp. Adler-ghost]QWE31044.1 hypothetical protein ICV89_01610 [Polynucleobacter sp. Adler-ghost]
MKTILLISDRYINQNTLDKFSLVKWEEGGWKFIAIDLSYLLERKASLRQGYINQKRNNKIILVHSYLEFYTIVKNLNHVHIYIDELNGNGILINALRLCLAIKNIKRMVMSCGGVPEGKRKLIFRVSFVNLYLYPINKIFNLFFKPDIVVLSGDYSCLRYKNIKHKIFAHNYDYDKFLAVENIKYKASEVVYIDQSFHNHPDDLYSRSNNTVQIKDVDNYYFSIKNFLLHFSKLLNANVLIALGPQSDDSKFFEKYFNHNQIISGKTFDLIANSKLVVGHSSTAMEIAILFKKPIIILTASCLENSNSGLDVEAMASALNKKPVYIESNDYESDVGSWSEFDEKKYEHYIHHYIKTKNSTKIKLWDIVIPAVDKVLQI